MAVPKFILVVDDDLNLRQTLVMILRSAGYDVSFAENAQKCLLLLKEREYDLMVLDHRMPDMNGLTLLTVVHNMYPRLPVLFLTGNGTSELEKEVSGKGVKGYLLKPVDPESILSQIRSICG
jgi:DNA-binding NtrC family response regulator